MGVPQNHSCLWDFTNFPFIWIAPFMENHHFEHIYGKIHHLQWAIFNSYAKLPEGSDQYEPLLITISHYQLMAMNHH